MAWRRKAGRAAGPLCAQIVEARLVGPLPGSPANTALTLIDRDLRKSANRTMDNRFLRPARRQRGRRDDSSVAGDCNGDYAFAVSDRQRTGDSTVRLTALCRMTQARLRRSS